MIYLSNFKNRPAICVESNTLKATFLPLDGAKMASLIRKKDGKELLAVKKGEKYAVLDYDGSYVDSECSGFDDMFPTVDPFTPTSGAFKGITYPDHGETCRIPYEVTYSDDSVILSAKSKIFPISYRKTISLEGESIAIEYEIVNDGENAFPFLWAGHIMLAGEDGMKIISPFTENTPTTMMFAPSDVAEGELDKTGLTGFMPKVGPAYKFYYEGKMQKGEFGAKYLDGSSILFEVDEKKLPYLGFWINNGQFQDIYTLTPEPCSLPYDSPERASKKGLTAYIEPKSEFTFQMKISLSEK